MTLQAGNLQAGGLIPSAPVIERARTAIVRGGASRPLRLALEGGVLTAGHSFFDFGCGRGEDVRLLQQQGFAASGWDPAHARNEPLKEADVVQLGYVLNVIEDPHERIKTLAHAYSLARSVLVVAVQMDFAKQDAAGAQPLGDGYLTSRRTFQKYFEQDEARTFIESVLGEPPVPAAPGVFFIFRKHEDRFAFLSRRRAQLDGRYVLRLPRPPRPPKVARVTAAQRRLQAAAPLVDRILSLGRWPEEEELDDLQQALSEFASPGWALRFADKSVPVSAFQTARSARANDVLVFLSLARFAGRPKASDLPRATQRDVKAFFGTYPRACDAADKLLFEAGRPDAVLQAARSSTIGKLLPDALYVHVSALPKLPPLLRVYEGCASEFVGEVAATILKLSLGRHPGVSYSHYPTFDKAGHPQLAASLRFDLATRKLTYRDYSGFDNVPILHRKETLVSPDYPLYSKFRKLTEQEEKHGLLDQAEGIGYCQQWARRLSERGWTVKGHRLVRQKPQAPSATPESPPAPPPSEPTTLPPQTERD